MARKSGTPSAAATAELTASVPGAPTFVSHTSSAITIDIAENSNASVVTYALYSIVHSKYIGADGVADEAAEVWQTAAAWGNVTVLGLSLYTAYTFKAKAKSEAGVETAFGANSAAMACLPDLDDGEISDNVELEVTTGNTKIEDDPVVSGNYATDDQDSFYGPISLTFELQSYRSLTGNGIEVQYSENGSSWLAATAAAGSCAISGLTASAAGVSYVYKWDSYTDAGASEQDTTVYLRIRATDSASAAGAWVTTAAFSLNNRPAKITWTRYGGDTIDAPFDKDTTPVLRAVIPSSRGGGPMFPEVTFYSDAAGTVVALALKSYESIAGWKYETAPGVWADMTFAGISDTYADGVNKMEITVQPADALAAADYIINGKMWEIRERG